MAKTKKGFLTLPSSGGRKPLTDFWHLLNIKIDFEKIKRRDDRTSRAYSMLKRISIVMMCVGHHAIKI